MKGNKVLLIAPNWMGLNDDIIEGLKNLSYEVDYIPEKQYPYDPFYYLSKRKRVKSVDAFMHEIEVYWRELLACPKYSCPYDYLLVVDGQAIHPILFDILNNRNPKIKKINFLFDRIIGVYAFDRNFKYFDKVFSFDPSDCKHFNLSLLQIYWVPIPSNHNIKYKLFGFGTYNKYRYDIFLSLSHVFSDVKGEKFIKVYNRKVHNKYLHELKNIIKMAIGMERNISIKELNSGLVVSETIPPAKFREIIASSDVIIDTSAPYQDGITARFMWALGAGKRIVTTNTNIVNYPFYSKEQVFILDINNYLQQKDLLLSFIEGEFVMSEKIKHEVEKYRIDNWIKILLN